jgi:periplasmic copper chaperone A
MFGLSRFRAIEIGAALLLTLAALLLAALRVWAAEGSVIRVDDPWARPTAGQSTTSAAYMTIANKGDADDLLKGAHAPKAKSVELHRTTMTAEGVMQMREVTDGLPIAAGTSVALEPGGLHLMLLGLETALSAGETLTLTLEFAKAGNVDVLVPVSAQEPAGADSAPHDHHHHH